MWYRYIRRSTDAFPIFRNACLKFDQEALGVLRFKNLSTLKYTIFRMGRSEGTLRGFFFFYFIGAITTFSALYDIFGKERRERQQAESKRQVQEYDKRARQILYYNNLGVPVRPTQNVEAFVAFISSGVAIEKATDFTSYCLKLNNDQLQGLDAAPSEIDEKMIDLINESKRRKGGH